MLAGPAGQGRRGLLHRAARVAVGLAFEGRMPSWRATEHAREGIVLFDAKLSMPRESPAGIVMATQIIPPRAITGVNACGRGNRQQFQYHLSQDPPSRCVRGAPPAPTPSTPSLSNWRRNVSAAQLPRPHGSSMSARDSRNSDWELRAPFVKKGVVKVFWS